MLVLIDISTFCFASEAVSTKHLHKVTPDQEAQDTHRMEKKKISSNRRVSAQDTKSSRIFEEAHGRGRKRTLSYDMNLDSVENKRECAKKKTKPWTEYEEKLFEEGVKGLHGWGNWGLVARDIPTRRTISKHTC